MLLARPHFHAPVLAVCTAGTPIQPLCYSDGFFAVYYADGVTMPDSFEEQGDIIWTHLGTILQSAGMNYNWHSKP